MDINKAVDNVLRSRAAISGNPLFGERIYINDSQKSDLKLYLREVAKRLEYCVDSLITTDDALTTKLVSKMAQAILDRDSEPPNKINSEFELKEAVDIFCRIMEANPTVLSSDASLFDIASEYKALQKENYLQATDDTDLEEFIRHCRNMSAIVDVTECSQGWLDTNLPAHIKADLVTYSENNIILSNLKTAGVIHAHQPGMISAPVLESAYRVKAGTDDNPAPVHAPSLKHLAFSAEASQLIAGRLESAYEVWVDNSGRYANSKDLNLPEFKRGEVLTTNGYNVFAANCEHLGSAAIHNANEVDLSSLYDVEDRVELTECVPLDGLHIPAQLMDDKQISLDDQGLQYAAAQRGLDIAEEAGILTVSKRQDPRSRFTVIPNDDPDPDLSP